MDFAIIGDATAELDDGILVLRVDLPASADQQRLTLPNVVCPRRIAPVILPQAHGQPGSLRTWLSW